MSWVFSLPILLNTVKYCRLLGRKKVVFRPKGRKKVVAISARPACASRSCLLLFFGAGPLAFAIYTNVSASTFYQTYKNAAALNSCKIESRRIIYPPAHF